MRTETLPLVVAHRADCSLSVVLTADQLAAVDESVIGFESALT